MTDITDLKDKIKASIFGAAVGDALGVPAEFKSRRELELAPVKEMTGYGTHNKPEGYWSDDTSMILATLDTLTPELNYENIMDAFAKWHDFGFYTIDDECFDCGNTVAAAVKKYGNGTEPLLCGGESEYDNGNGSLMRIAPVAFYLKMRGFESPFDSKEALEIVHNISSLTHRHLRSKIACGIFVSVLCALIDEPLKQQIDLGIKTAYDYYSARSEYSEELKHFDRIFDKNFGNLSRDEIRSSGYVVDTLEAALWCIKTTDDFTGAVLRGVNLGEDADTVAAVTGAAAGLVYGYCKELDGFSKQIKRRQFIEQLCEEFYINNI